MDSSGDENGTTLPSVSIVVGAEDDLLNPHNGALMLHRFSTNARMPTRLRLFRGSGHFLQLEKPGRFNEALSSAIHGSYS